MTLEDGLPGNHIPQKPPVAELAKGLPPEERDAILASYEAEKKGIKDMTKNLLACAPLINALENATLSLHTDNALDPSEKIEAAKKSLLDLKKNPHYSEIAFAGGIEQKQPITQKVAELEGAIKRAENKEVLCRSFSQKIRGKGEIEFWDSDWLALNEYKTSITININWGSDISVINSGDDCAGFTMQETYDILSANKTFFEKGNRTTATPQKKPESDTEKTPEASIKYLEEWSRERDWASGRRQVIDTNGGDYEKVQEVGNWEYPDKYAHIDFLEGMMKNFDDGVDYASNQQNLAKTGVKKTGKRLGEVKKYLTEMKVMIDKESDPVKKTSLQKSYDEIEVKYRADQKRYVTISANLGNSYKEQEEFINTELAVKNATEYVQGAKSADDAIRYLRNIHSTILNNLGQSGKAKETYKAVTQAVGKTIFEKIQNDTTLDQTQKNKKMVELAQLVSQREGDIDDEVQDSALAIDVLEKVISMPDAAIGFMKKQGKKSPLQASVNRLKGEVTNQPNGASFISPEQQKILDTTPRTLEDISQQYALLRYLKLALENMKIAQKRAQEKPPTTPYLTLNQSELQDEINKSMVPYIEQGTNGLYMQLDQSGNNTLAKFQEFTGLQLTAEQQKAYTLLHDIKGLGWWNTSDATNASLVQGAKIAGMIVVGIAAGIATGGAGFVAYAAAGAAMTAAECVFFNKAMGVKETVTTTAINTAGIALGGALSGTKSAGIGAQAVGAGLARAGAIGKAALKIGGALDNVAARGAGVITKVPGVQKGLNALRSMDEAGGAKALASEAIQSGVDYSSGAVMESVRQQVMEGKGAEEAFLAALSDPTSLAMIGVPIGMRLSPKGIAFVKKTFQGQNSESALRGLEDGTIILPDSSFEAQKVTASDMQYGNLLSQIQSEIANAKDEISGNFGAVRRGWAEKIIHTFRGNETPLSPQELQAIQDAHTIPATGPDGKYTPSDITKKSRRLEEAFPGSEGKNIREALIRNGVCGDFRQNQFLENGKSAHVTELMNNLLGDNWENRLTPGTRVKATTRSGNEYILLVTGSPGIGGFPELQIVRRGGQDVTEFKTFDGLSADGQLFQGDIISGSRTSAIEKMQIIRPVIDIEPPKIILKVAGAINDVPNQGVTTTISTLKTPKPSLSDLQSGKLLAQIQSEILAANDGDFGPIRKKWAENTTPTLPHNTYHESTLKEKINLLIGPNDATNVLFHRGYVPVKGPSIDIDAARSTMLRIVQRRPNLIDSLHGAQLVHGSNSASLLSFTQYGAFRGDLLPIGIMEEQGRIPFSGEISFGRHGINQESLSTCWVGSILNAKHYAFAGDPWSFESTKDSIQRLKQELLDSEHQDSPNSRGIQNMIEVNTKRISDWDKLDAQEKKLVSEPFPIMYGIHPTRQNTLHFVRSDIDGEIGLKGGATSDEITVIFVPNEKIKEVQEILEKSGKEHIKVVDMSYAFQFSKSNESQK